MTTAPSESATSGRRTPEQKLAYLRQQVAKTEAALAQKARKRRVRSLIVLGSTVTMLRDGALNERLLAEIINKADREAVAALIAREGSPR